MSYKVYYTDRTKDYIEVNDSTINTETSLALPGRNQRGYGIAVAESFVHLLENFANTTAPENPIEGQVWYDKSEGVEELKVYDGTQWKSSGSVKKTASTPASAITGDLWVDTDNQQLFLFNGATWVLVGPTFSTGLRTGIVPETIVDINDIDRVIIKTYIDDEIVSIYSADTFIPKVLISGFSEIKSGINLSGSIIVDGDVSLTPKYYGISEKAENLLIGTTTVPASNFLRKDSSNITDFGFTVRNDQGIATGLQSQLRLTVDSNTTGSIYHSTTDSQFDIRINYRGEITTLLRASSNGNVGIGINNLAPAYSLDVAGTSRFTDIVKVESGSDVLDSEGPAFQVLGGAQIGKDLSIIGNSLHRKGITVANYASANTTEINDRNAISPIVTNTFDIGATDKRFRNVYANSFYGNLVGDLTGNISGTSNVANRLAAGTTFQMVGQVTAEPFTFDGSTGGTLKTFETTISSTLIANQALEFTDVNGSDEFLVYRGETGQLGKMYRTTLFQQVATIPIGTILPFAGTTPPIGYLLCDGSEKSRTIYFDLFAVIGYTYGLPDDPVNPLEGDTSFRLPDLRGRFLLGRSTMDNADSIETPDGIIDSNTLPIDEDSQNTEATAGILGNTSGSPSKTLNVANIPNHTHELTDSLGNDYYTIARRTGTPEDVNASPEYGLAADTQTQIYDRTGSMINKTDPTTSFNIMNPYMTINYIIYTGKLV